MWAGPIKNLLNAFDRILDLDVDKIVPGHGPVTDKNGVQLSQAREMLSHLQQLDPDLKNDRISYGSLAHTNEGTYYFSVSFGKVVMSDQPYFVLSMVSPIGKALHNRKAGEEVAFMGRRIRIEKIM